MYKLNGKGPSIDPWGTPIVEFIVFEWTPFIFTHCCLFNKYEEIQAKAPDESWNLDNLVKKTLINRVKGFTQI